MTGVDWETVMALNPTWGCGEHNPAWKSDDTLIRNLIGIASEGGNDLLHIGLKGDGSVPGDTLDKIATVIATGVHGTPQVARGTLAGRVFSPPTAMARTSPQALRRFAH